MAQTKSKKPSQSQWYQCEQCNVFISNKDTENHEQFCPPDLKVCQQTFILDQILYGVLDIKTNEEIKNLSSRQKDGLVFVSQSAMQLCGFSIGEFVIVNKADVAVALRVWPTVEKALTSVLVTKNCLTNMKCSQNDIVKVRKMQQSLGQLALDINLLPIRSPKSLEFTIDVCRHLTNAFQGSFLTIGNHINTMFFGSVLKFQVKQITKQTNADISETLEQLSIDSPSFYLVDNKTKWKIIGAEDLPKESLLPRVPKVAGLDKEFDELWTMVKAVFTSPNPSQIQIRSALLYGNTGTGKTSLAKAIAAEFHINIVELCVADLYTSESSPEDFIKSTFKDLTDKAPAVLLLDDVDQLCPSKNGRSTDSEKRIHSTIIKSIDFLMQQKTIRVFLLATTSKIDNIDPSLRRFGRLDREVEIPTPSPQNRLLILQLFLKDIDNKLNYQEVQELAQITHGYVGGDLLALCSEASLFCTRRNSFNLEITDFKQAIKKVKPSAMREVLIEVPNVKWSDIGGQDNLKLVLKQAVEWPLKYADSFIRLGVTPPKGVLMFGPPGCSKTMIARALATESGLNFLSIKGPELFSKWVGDSEKAVREVFRKARQVAPSIVFFDEIDAVGGERGSGSSTSVQERVLAQLLTELDGITPLNDVTILAATNRPDKIDKALLRPGRLDRIVYVPLPDDNTRRDIFRIKFTKIPVVNVDLDNLVRKTEGYSGAEVNAVCNEAAMFALQENLQSAHVKLQHFEQALEMITPRTSQDLIKLYQEYTKTKI